MVRTFLPLLLTALLTGCAADSDDAEATNNALATPAGTLVPETAPTQAVVLANADLFAGVNELHYTLLRGLFSDRALDDVKVMYLSPSELEDVQTPVRSRDGDRLSARFSTRFSAEIRSGRLKRVDAPVESNWARDYFPMVLGGSSRSGRPAVHFDYAVVPETGPAAASAARTLGFDVSHAKLELEGGNIMIDADGTLFTTTKILERNKPKSKSTIEAELKQTLGAREIEWLEPLPGESTGHVDIIAKVVGPKRVIVGSSNGICSREAPATCKKRKPALDKVAATFEQRGYRVTRIENAEGPNDPRALTYANSLLVNGTAFIPMYFDPALVDEISYLDDVGVPAKQIIKDCNTRNPFPGTTDLAADLVVRERARCAVDGVVPAAKRAGEPTARLEQGLELAKHDQAAKKAYEALGLRVVQVPSAAMINFGGSIHCVTMQLPK